MRLVYVDEAGIASEEQEPFTVVASVTVNGDEQWKFLESDIADLRTDLGVPLEAELKACNIFWGREEFQSWSREDRKRLQRDFLLLLSRYKLPIAVGIVERAHFRKLVEPYTPEGLNLRAQDIAFLMCAQEVEADFCGKYSGEVGAIVADDSDREAELKKSFAEYRRKPLPGPFRAKFNHLIEPILFASSHESWGLQLADHCAFFIKRHTMGKEDSYEFHDLFKHSITGSPLFVSSAASTRILDQVTTRAAREALSRK